MKGNLAELPRTMEGANRAAAFDPIELEILWKRLISVVDEASAAFVRTCFSTLVRDGNDFAIVLTDAQGRSLAQSTMSLPGFIGCLPATVRAFLEKFPAETMKPGDVFITNDPWKGSGHVHDVTTATPIFHGGKLVGFAAVVSHLPDIGGKLRSNSSREIYEEGLQIPLMRLLDGGKPNDILIEIISQNVRVPEQGLGDIWAQVSGCRTMSERLQSLLETVNLDALGAEVRLRSENAMRTAIRDIPDGVYRSTVQHDGFDEPILIECELTVKGDEISIDYAGTSPQLPHALNVVPIYTFAYTVYGLKALLCPDIPNNEGSFLPISTRAPLGSLLKSELSRGLRRPQRHRPSVAGGGVQGPVRRSAGQGLGFGVAELVDDDVGRVQKQALCRGQFSQCRAGRHGQARRLFRAQLPGQSRQYPRRDDGDAGADPDSSPRDPPRQRRRGPLSRRLRHQLRI